MAVPLRLHSVGLACCCWSYAVIFVQNTGQINTITKASQSWKKLRITLNIERIFDEGFNCRMSYDESWAQTRKRVPEYSLTNSDFESHPVSYLKKSRKTKWSAGLVDGWPALLEHGHHTRFAGTSRVQSLDDDCHYNRRQSLRCKRADIVFFPWNFLVRVCPYILFDDSVSSHSQC